MTYYLVTGTITKTPYMEEPTEMFDDIRLVKAVGRYEAEGKYERFWQDQGRDYSHTYYVHIKSATPTIE